MKHSAILWRALFSFITGFAFIIIYNGTPAMAVGMVWVMAGVMIMGYGIARKNWMLWAYVATFILFALFTFVAGWMGGGAGYAMPLLIGLICTYFLLAHDPLRHLTGKRTYPPVELGLLTKKLNKVAFGK